MPSRSSVKHETIENWSPTKGSVIGLISFLHCIKDFTGAVQNSEIILFADDTNFQGELKNFENTENYLREISKSMAANKMTLNTGKFHFTLISLEKVASNSLRKNQNVNHLGVILNEKHYFSEHIDLIKKN